MKITLVRSMARSAVFELVNSGCYRAPAPYTVSLDGATVCEGDTNVFSLYSLEPGRSYTLAVTLDGVTDTLDFTTAEESFFVDASRYGLVADGVTDNTAKLQAALVRAYLVDYFRSAAPEYGCTDETLLTGMMCRFADMNFSEQSQKVQQEYLKVYERRKARLQEQIDALQAKAEAEEMAVSMQEAPDAEPEMPELLPDEMPDAEPSPEPLIIPLDPDIEPDTRMPEEMKSAA